MEEFEPKRKTKIFTKEFVAKYSYVLVLAVLLIGGISYGYTFFTENKKIASGSITTANLTINFSNREINASNLTVPANDQEGLSEFSKSLTITNQTAIDGKVKLKLTRTSGLALTDMRYAIAVNGAIQEIDDVPSDGEILSSAIMGNDSMDVEVMLWPKSTYSGSTTTFVGEITPEISYLGNTATDTSNLTGKYVNFNGNEVWQIVKVENDRLVLTRQADYSGATSRTNSNRYNPSLTFNDNSLITSVSTDNKNVYLAKTVKINSGTGTQADSYNLVNNDFREEDKKVIAVITYKHETTTIGTQNIYYNETNYISQVYNDLDFTGWSDGTNEYELGDVINISSDTNLTAVIVPKLSSKIMTLCNDSNISYVQKYNVSNGAAIDTPDGSGNEDVCYYTTTSTTRNSDAEQNGNVIFGDYCWQIVRTTSDGGVKLIYNGPKTNDNKCTSDADTTNYSSNPRPASIGVIGTNTRKKTTVSGSKKYGTSFEIFVDANDNNINKFRLKDVEQLSWSDSTYENIIGKYVCGNSSSPTGVDETCTVLYYVGHYQSNTEASVEKYTIGTNAHYSQIGTSSYNAFYDSPALVGYMYNDVYTYKTKEDLPSSLNVLESNYVTSNYYYGDAATWVTDHYELTIGGATPTSTTAWSSIRSSVQGMYTCLSTTDTSCTVVHYAVANSTDSYMYSIPLSNNESADTKKLTWTIGTGYQEINGVYSLTGTSTLTILLKDWYTNYNNSQYKKYYICDNLTSSTCTSEVYYVGATSNYQILYNKSSVSYIFGNSVDYQNGNYIILNTNTPSNQSQYQEIWNFYETSNSVVNIRNSHYTCFTNSNTCSDIYFVYLLDNSITAYYIKLSNNERIEDALQKMLNKDNSSSSLVNKYNSTIKGAIDSWYESNLSSLSGYLDNDAVYCNDRTIVSYGGWTANSPSAYELSFKYRSSSTKANATLSCTNMTDRFSKNNAKAKLEYSIGLLTEPERAMMYSGYIRTNQEWWLISPRTFNNIGAFGSTVSTTGGNSSSYVYAAKSIRPVIVLKPGITITGGNGTYNTPYIIDINS